MSGRWPRTADRRVRAPLAGALAGLGAAAAQTGASRVVSPRLPTAMRPDAFVPLRAIRWARRRFGLLPAEDPVRDDRIALALHLAYGAGLGAIFGVLRPHLRGVPAPLAGGAYGVLAWALGFEGWLPALGVMPRTTALPPAKWPAPILGHALFGVVLGVGLEGLVPAEAESGSAGICEWPIRSPGTPSIV